MGEQSNEGLNISVLSVPDAAKILASAYGRRITEDDVREAAERGELVRADGTISLIQFAAFLAKEVTCGD